MKRKVLAVALFCLVLFGAILAGYWDMLDAERLRLVRDQADRAVGEIASIVRNTAEPEGEGAGKLPAPEAADAPPPVPPREPSKTAAPPAGTPSPEEAGSGGASAKAGAGPDRGSPSAATPPGASAAPVTASGPTTAQPPAAPGAPNAPSAPEASIGAASATAVPPAGIAAAPAPATNAAPSDGEPPAAAADTPGIDEARQAAASPQPQQAPPAASSAAASDAVPASEPLAAPTFDILRVEPDGSTVLAGKAPVGATVRLQDGEEIIGSDTASPSGDFVVVLDERLAAGDHEIRIEATTADGRSATSAETAIVSIPEPGREGELLALVEKPDAASRLITLPTAPPAERSGAQGADTGTGSPSAGDAILPEGSAGTPGDAAASQPLPAKDTARPEGTGEGPASGAAAVDPAASGRSQPNRSDTGPEDVEGVSPSLAVEAVEIEDDTIYVAGRAPIGRTVRVYVDNRFLAEDAGREGDRFLVTSTSAVAPGKHMVRADEIAADGSVVTRVEVPFFKPEGRTMAAISPAEPPELKPDLTDAPAAAGESPSSQTADGAIAAFAEPLPTSGTAGPSAERQQTDASGGRPLQAPADATGAGQPEPASASSTGLVAESGSVAPGAPAASGRDGETAPAPSETASGLDVPSPADEPASQPQPQPQFAAVAEEPSGPGEGEGAPSDQPSAVPPEIVLIPAPAQVELATGGDPDASDSAEPASTAAPGTRTNVAAPFEGAGGGTPAPTDSEALDAEDTAAISDFPRPEPVARSIAPDAPTTVNGGSPSAGGAGAPPSVPAPAPQSGPTPEDAAGPVAPPVLSADATERPAATGPAASPLAQGQGAPVAGSAIGRSDAPGASASPSDPAPATAGAAALPSAFPPVAGSDRGTPGTEIAGSLGAAAPEIAVIRQPPLQAKGSRVIIRRGDTLWRISRETYGRGARYTVIYLANGDQIRSPHRIYPGQVFRVPEGDADGGASKTGPEGKGR